MPRKPLPVGEKKKPLTIFIKEKQWDAARHEAAEIERKYNTAQSHQPHESAGLAGSQDHQLQPERLA
jgi:uncharacterized protein YdaL